jgi:hypothetical protein
MGAPAFMRGELGFQAERLEYARKSAMVGAPAFMRGSSAFKPSGSSRANLSGFSRGVSESSLPRCKRGEKAGMNETVTKLYARAQLIDSSRGYNQLRSNSLRLTHILLNGNIAVWQLMSKLILLG